MMKRALLLSLFFVACHHEVAKEPAAIKAVDPCTLMSADALITTRRPVYLSSQTSSNRRWLYWLLSCGLKFLT